MQSSTYSTRSAVGKSLARAAPLPSSNAASTATPSVVERAVKWIMVRSLFVEGGVVLACGRGSSGAGLFRGVGAVDQQFLGEQRRRIGALAAVGDPRTDRVDAARHGLGQREHVLLDRELFEARAVRVIEER